VNTNHNLEQPERGSPGKRTGSAVATALFLMICFSTLVGCSRSPTPTDVSSALPTTTSSLTPSPSPSLTPLPTTAPTETPNPPTSTPTVDAEATASAVNSTTNSGPSATPSPSATATATGTPSPTPTNSSTPSPAPTLDPNPSPVPTTAFTKDIIHILLIGSDRNYALDVNTDSLIVAVVNRKTKQVSLLSIPRDLWVYIPTHGWGRINTAFRIGARNKYPEGRGPGLLARTIEENLGIPIDNYVRVNYDGFVRVVDELGGVDMVVPCRTNLRYKAPTSEGEQEMILEPGVHHLDGETALRYVRTRRGDSDFDRSGRQQQFLKAVWNQFKSTDILPRIPGLWSALKDNFYTDLSLGDVVALAPVALDLQPQRIRSRYIGRNYVQDWMTPEGASVLLPIPEKIGPLVASLYAPPESDEDQVANEGARIQVWNGTQRPQLELIAADQLGWGGLKILDTGPADRSDYTKTEIVVFEDKPEALALLTQLLEVRPENVSRQPDAGQPADGVQADLLVILGEDYDPCE